MAGSLALGLTVVFLIPQISSNEGLKNDPLNPNTFLVLVLFVGLILGLFSSGLANPEEPLYPYFPPGKPHFVRHIAPVLSNVFFASAIFIVWYNWLQFKQIVKVLKASLPLEAAPYTFNGRPSKDGDNKRGSEIVLQHLEPFWKVVLEGAKKKPTIRFNPDLKDKAPWRPHYDKKGRLQSVSAGIRKQDLWDARRPERLFSREYSFHPHGNDSSAKAYEKQTIDKQDKQAKVAPLLAPSDTGLLAPSDTGL